MKADGNLGLGILVFFVGVIWLLNDLGIIPEVVPVWGIFLIVLGAVLMWSSAKSK